MKLLIISTRKREKAEWSLISDEGDYEQEFISPSFIDGDEILRKLDAALEKLPEKQRLVFNMRYYDEMTYDQISEVLDTSVGGLKPVIIMQ